MTAVIRSLPRKRNKYGAKPDTIDGHRFDSSAEAKHYCLLKLRVRLGEISDLKVHPRYPLIINGTHCGVYEADFSYVEKGNGVQVIDVKGVRTALYILKRNVFEALYGLNLTEVDVGRSRKRRAA